MASRQPSMSLSHSSFSEKEEWLINIRQSMKEKTEEVEGISVSVFNVPKPMKLTRPEAYNPQLIAIGPYHHWSHEPYEMEQYKISAAKRCQKKLKTLKLEDAVECFMDLEQEIRAHYHRYLDLDGKILAWMMAIDVSFLLEFLQIYEEAEGRGFNRVESRMSILVDNAGRKSTHNVIIRDIMMLENQIPLVLLRKFLELQCSSPESADQKLSTTLTCLMKELSPFKMTDENFPSINVEEHHNTHLLGLLYRLLVREHEIEDQTDAQTDEIAYEDAETDLKDTDDVQNCSFAFLGFLPSLKLSPKPIKALANVLPKTFPYLQKLKSKTEELSSDHYTNNSIPSTNEIMIPSVTDLLNVGVTFESTNGDLNTIAFDRSKVTLYLPTVRLDVNTEVILRNLVAYEASVASGPLAFTRYTELMNGIIDTEEDARHLQNMGIVINGMENNAKVANLWNGMSKSVRLTSVPKLDKVIREVNSFYNSRWRVKAQKFIKVHVLDSWQFLTFLAAVLMLLLTGVQAFCSVYSCSRWFVTD